MKPLLPLLFILCLAACSSTPSVSSRWKEIKDLTGEPLVVAMAKDADPAFAELNERRRNVRLEVIRLEPLAKSSDEQARAYEIQKALEESLTKKLYEDALERKMAVWKTAQLQK